MESMKHELEEKIRKLEEDKQNMDISAGKLTGISKYIVFSRVKIPLVLFKREVTFVIIVYGLNLPKFAYWLIFNILISLYESQSVNYKLVNWYW